MQEHAKDLYVLVADADMRQVMSSILRRSESLGIRPIKYSIERHLRRDPGCRQTPLQYLRSISPNYRYSLVMFDKHGCGDDAMRHEIQRTVERELARNGWEGRSKVIVIEPELETWVWNGSVETSRILGWGRNYASVEAWLSDNGLLPEGAVKPPEPKDAMIAAMREKRTGPISPALFGRLARSTSLHRCQCPAFGELRDTLQRWFPAA